jgi:hypothetical protein
MIRRFQRGEVHFHLPADKGRKQQNAKNYDAGKKGEKVERKKLQRVVGWFVMRTERTRAREEQPR